MTMPQLWSFLKQNNQLENGDVVVPANLVKIITALAISMQETALRMNVMEDQLTKAKSAASRIDNLEQQMKALIEVQRTPTPAQARTTGPNGLPTKPRSWATTAAAGLKVTSTQAPQPPPSNHVINAFRPSQVVIRVQEGKKPFENIKAGEIVKRVNEALTQLNVMIGNKKVEVKGAANLPSGSIKLFTSTRAEATWLLENRHTWSTLADPNMITTPAIFPVIVDSVPMEFFNDDDGIVEVLTTQNPIPLDKIHSVRWLSKPHEKQTSGSIILNLLDKELTNVMMRGSVYFEGYSLRVRMYKRSRVQCFRCQEPGHISMQCKNDLLCKLCGANHDSRLCPSPKTDQPQCVRCIAQDTAMDPNTPIDKSLEKYSHSASSTTCPIRSKSLKQSPSASC